MITIPWIHYAKSLPKQCMKLNRMLSWNHSSQHRQEKTNVSKALSWQEDRAYAGKQPERLPGSKKGRAGAANVLPQPVLFYPLEKLKALNPGGRGAEPPFPL